MDYFDKEPRLKDTDGNVINNTCSSMTPRPDVANAGCGRRFNVGGEPTMTDLILDRAAGEADGPLAD